MACYFFAGTYHKTPNECPWAFANFMGLKKTFPPFDCFLQNDIAKNVKKTLHGGLGVGEGRLLEWAFIRGLTVYNTMLPGPDLLSVCKLITVLIYFRVSLVYWKVEVVKE